MTAVIYARYSSDNQREESIEGQIRECTAYAEKNGITVVKHYIDRAISAKTDNRPEFQQMIKDSDKKLFDIVLVWKLDRFARNRYDSARYKTQLKKNGVKLMSATEIISEGPEGIILESVLEGYAEYYSADLAEKVVRGQTENILKGRCNGGRGTFGYTLDSERKFHIDPLTSPFVLESFKKYNEGSTMKEIRDWLNENGIKNPVGGVFTYNSVEHMLKNRRYIGELKFRDVVVPDAIPPIVPLELFEDVQEKIAKNKKAPARRKAEDDYLLTTKLFCGYCGALMFGESGTSRTGEVHRYYKCATAKKHKGCKKKTVRKQWLEDLVVNQTMQLVRDDAAMESIIAKVMELQDRENTNLPLYEKQLRDAESGIQNMLNAIQAGILTSSTKERLEQLEETIMAVRNDMLTKVTARLFRHGNERFLQRLPAEYVDSHGSQVTARICRLLLKLGDTVILIGDHDTEAACLFDRHRHTCDGDICVVCFVIFQHNLIIHLIDVVAGKDQNVVRIVAFHVLQVLINGVRSTGIPVTALASLVRRKNGNSSDITVQVPRNANSDVTVQT